MCGSSRVPTTKEQQCIPCQEMESLYNTKLRGINARMRTKMAHTSLLPAKSAGPETRIPPGATQEDATRSNTWW
jgi:hypothetical protein